MKIQTNLNTIIFEQNVHKQTQQIHTQTHTNYFCTLQIKEKNLYALYGLNWHT